MNSLLLIIVGVPILEILVMIKIGQQIGAINTVLLIFLTAIIGVYYAKIEGLNTIKSGVINLYQNKAPVYEMISGASIAMAAVFLIIPGFITDAVGFLLLLPFTRKIIISFLFKKKYEKQKKDENEVIEAEIIEEKKDKNEL
ncbi:MAG: FxsA family protein [Rickettsiales bacterium TMED254]|jgi:UPF0716 protein FxsA|nr:MAG: FxsA family protein [Rickettsiales bacterium TMED254]|tara:strand:+ start:3515 stop:3940 length:426 start_codon:yes stop_codon:yes gene_type:complete